MVGKGRFPRPVMVWSAGSFGGRASSTFCHLGTFSNLANVGHSKRLILPDREKQYEKGDGVAMHTSWWQFEAFFPGLLARDGHPAAVAAAHAAVARHDEVHSSAAPATSLAPGWWPRSVNGWPLSNRPRAGSPSGHAWPASSGSSPSCRVATGCPSWRRVALRTGWQALALARLGRPPRRRSRRWSSSRPAASISRVPSPRCRSSRSGPAGTSSAPSARTA
jgi:hypothetical protein